MDSPPTSRRVECVKVAAYCKAGAKGCFVHVSARKFFSLCLALPLFGASGVRWFMVPQQKAYHGQDTRNIVVPIQRCCHCKILPCGLPSVELQDNNIILPARCTTVTTNNFDCSMLTVGCYYNYLMAMMMMTYYHSLTTILIEVPGMETRGCNPGLNRVGDVWGNS